MTASRLAAFLIAAAGLGWGAVPAHAYTVYVSNEKGNSLTVIDSDTLQVLTTIPVGQRPRGIMLSKDDKTVLICASDFNTVQVLDVGTRQIVAELPSGPDPVEVAQNILAETQSAILPLVPYLDTLRWVRRGKQAGVICA